MTGRDEATETAELTMNGFRRDVEVAVLAARAGAAAIRPFYRPSGTPGIKALAKGDGSPVTEADLASDAAIRAVLREHLPTDAILTEEGEDDLSRLAAQRVWVADPLDGTKEFVDQTDDFDVLVALVVDGRPIVAVTCHPMSDAVLCAAHGGGAWVVSPDSPEADPLIGARRLIYTPRPNQIIAVTSVYYDGVASRSFLADVGRVGGWDAPFVLETGFNPRYFGAGEPEDRPFDLFLGWTPSGWMSGGEWDLVVTDLIVAEAGGVCSDLWGRPHEYNKRVARNHGGLIIAADQASHEAALTALASHRPNVQ